MNTRLLLPAGLDGIGWFTHESLSRITRELSDWTFTFLFDRPFDQRYIYGDNVKGVVLQPPARHPLLYLLYFEWSVAQYLDRHKADFFFSPDGFLSLRSSIPQLAVIHDINFEHRPKDLPWAYRTYYRNMFPRFAKKAAHILTVSEYSKQDIHRTYGIPEDRIDVTYNGASDDFKPLTESEKIEAQDRFAGGSPYWVFVGNFSHRKNVHGIIEAFGLYRQKGGTKKLLLVGNPLWQYAEMKLAYANSAFRDDIIFAGHLSRSDLASALGAAFAMLFPSFFEGFGIPIIEAFRCEVPVITSTVTSLPEVAGKGGILVQPEKKEEIFDAMNLLENSEDQRLELIQNGIEQSKLFSWAHTANKVKTAMFNMATSTC